MFHLHLLRSPLPFSPNHFQPSYQSLVHSKWWPILSLSHLIPITLLPLLLMITAVPWTFLHIFPVPLQSAYWIAPLPALISRVHQLICLQHQLFHQKQLLQWLQTLKFQLSLLLRQNNKLACMTSSKKCHLNNFLQVGEREKEIMKREIKRNIWSEKRMKKKNNLGKKLEGVNRIRLLRGREEVNSKSKPMLNLEMILLWAPFTFTHVEIILTAF